jgi:amino acid transporter
LNYLLKRPRFLATCVFGVAFILVGNASSNALSFARHVLAAAGYSDNIQNSARGIAIATVTAVCLLHGLWRKLGIAVNNVFAFVKISILVMIIIIGFVSIGGKVFGVEPPAGANLDPHDSFLEAQTDPYGYASAYLAVVFAFGGFNQANYVSRTKSCQVAEAKIF